MRSDCAVVIMSLTGRERRYESTLPRNHFEVNVLYRKCSSVRLGDFIRFFFFCEMQYHVSPLIINNSILKKKKYVRQKHWYQPTRYINPKYDNFDTFYVLSAERLCIIL